MQYNITSIKLTNNYYYIMKNEIENYISRIITSFDEAYNDSAKHVSEMRASFAASVTAEEGRKYIKINTRSGVHSFIVIDENDKKFKYGDILKAASWRAPTRNFKRANVFESDSYAEVNWTGIC